MPQVDFYLLKQTAIEARYPFACRLLEKAYQHGHQLLVHTSSKEESTYFDNLLWTFSDASFIPHNQLDNAQEPRPPLQISEGLAAQHHNDILLNLNNEIPAFFQQFKRVIEIVPADDAWRKQARNHFRHYREAGCEINTHDLSK